MVAREGGEGERSPLATASKALLALAIVGSALAAGAVHATTLCIVTAVLGVAAGLAWGGARPFRARGSVTILLAVGIGLTLFTALQLVPLPVGLLAKIAPANADIWARSLEPLGLAGPSWAPITVDPIATRVELLKCVAYLCAFLVAVRVCHRREGVVLLECVILASCMTMAAAAALHPAFGAQKLFGVYKPEYAYGRHIAPLLNPNHLAGYLNVGACIAFSMALTPRPRIPRVLAAACALTLAGTQLWIASRGGVLAMVFGACLVLWSTRSAAPSTAGVLRLRQLLPGFIVVGSVGMAVLAASEDAMTELASADFSKLELARASLRAAPSFAIFGAGRGAFESVFPAFRTDKLYISFTHPENIVAQWTVEWGILASVAAAVAITLALRPKKQARPELLAGAWAAIAATALHNLADFNSELPAVGIVMVVCAAIVVSGPSRTPAERASRWAQAPTAVAVGALVAAVIAIVLAVPRIGQEVHDDREAFADLVSDTTVSPTEFREAARSVMLRHPGDAYFPYAGAAWALQAHEGSVIPWVSRAFERFPAHGPAHMVLARWLRNVSPSQARLEYRLALETSGAAAAIVAEASPLLREQSDALSFADTAAFRVETLGALVTAVRERLPATAQILDARLMELKPELVAPAMRVAETAVRDVEAETREAWCDDDIEGCIASAKEAVQRVRTAVPRSCEPYALAARLGIATGSTADALRAFSADAETVDDRRECLKTFLLLARSVKARASVDLALQRMAHSGCNDPEDCGQLYLFLSTIEQERGNSRSALALLKKGHEASPGDMRILKWVGLRAAALGLHQEALDAFTETARHDTSDADLPIFIAREKLALTEDRLVQGLQAQEPVP